MPLVIAILPMFVLRLIAILPKWLLLFLVGWGGIHAKVSSAYADQAGAVTTSVQQGISMAFSITDAIRQNTLGMSEGFPLGVPRSYNWYKGWNPDGMAAPPANFTSVTGWGQVYYQEGQPAYTNPNARVEVANARTYVHLRSTGEWVLVQNQATNPVVGGHFVTNFAGNAGSPMNVTIRPDGSSSFAAPPTGYNDHFWQGARGTYRAGDVDAVYVQMDMRVTDPNLNLVASVGADWWRDANAPYLQDHSTNPGAGSSNWIELSTEWRTASFFSSRAILQADPPPPLLGQNVEERPTLTSFSPDTSTVGDGVTSSNVLTLSGAAKPGVSVAIFDGSTRIGTATANASGSWSFTTGQLSGSSHAFTAKNLAANGSTGLTSSALTVTVDRTAPAVPRIVSFSPDTATVGDGVTSANRLTLTGTAEPGIVVRLFDGSSQIGTATANANGQWTFATAQLSNATHSFSATATDRAGNTSAASTRMNVRVNATTPGPNPTDPPSNGTNLLINGSFEATPVTPGQWSGSASIPGWTALSGSKIELWNNTNGVRASSGSNYGELDFLGGDDGLYQSVRTTAGQSYKLSFDSRSRPGFTGATCTIEVWWNDTLVASVPPGADWATYNFKVTGTGGQDRLTFREARGQGDDGLGALYDNVSLIADGSAPPPRPPNGADLLLNGSFEATSLAAGQWGGFNSLPGWTAVAGGTIELWNNLNGVRATDGENFGELDYLGATDGLYQTVATDAGQRYELSFDARSRPGAGASTCTVEVLWNDKVVARVPPGSEWDTYNFTVTGTGGQDRLTFREAQGQGGDGDGALYDNVSLVAVNSATSATSSAVAQMDRALDVMTQYSAATFATSNVAPNSVLNQAGNQDSLAPTLTQTHQLT